VLTEAQLEELRRFDTPTVWNALEGFGLRPNTAGFTHPGLSLRTPNAKPLVGYAATAKVSGWEKPTAAQREMLFALFADVRAINSSSVVVIQDVDAQPIGSFWGEVQATTFKALGAAGTLTQGGVRDLNEVGPLGFYLFSTQVMVARAESHLLDHGCQVSICGMEVSPGDLIHADVHGALTIPAAAAADLASACRRVTEAELQVLAPCRKALTEGVKPEVADLRRWRQEMSQRR
jgi:regulator of RNase E activity RraA